MTQTVISRLLSHDTSLTLGDGHFYEVQDCPRCGSVTGTRNTCVPLWLTYSNHRSLEVGIPPRNLMLEERAEALGAARGLCLMKNGLRLVLGHLASETVAGTMEDSVTAECHHEPACLLGHAS